jgi:hypothetical protein
MKEKQIKKETTDQDRAQTWQTRFNRCETNQEKLFNKVSKFYDIMYAVQSNENVAPWRAKIYVPIMASKAWDLIARLSSVLPYFRTRINDEVIVNANGDMEIPKEVRDRQKRLDAKLSYEYQYGQEEPMKLKVFDTMLDAVVAGTGFAKAGWEHGEETYFSREYDEKGMVKDMGTEKVKKLKKGHNTFEPINFFNVFIGDNASNYGKAKYVIVRYFKPLDELKANPMYKNVNLLIDTPNKGNFDIHNQARNRLVNEPKSDMNDDTVPTATVYECYERTPNGTKCMTFGIGKSDKVWVEIEEPKVKYWHNHFPVQPFYCRRKSYSPWGESLFENNSSLQYATNDLFNHYLDNWNLSIDSMIMYEDGTLTSDFIIEPGGEITYTGEKPEAFKFPEPNPAQLSMVMGVIEKAVENATVPQYISGVPNSGIDKTAGTAKGISMISEAATEKIGYMRDNFKQSMVMVGKIWLSNLQQYQDMTEEIRTFERGAEKPDIVLPSDYAGDIALTIDDDSLTPMTKEEKRGSLEALTAQALMIQKASIEQANILGSKDYIPIVNYAEILEESVQYYAVKDPARFIVEKSETEEADPMDMSEEDKMMALNGTAQNTPEGQDPMLAETQGKMGAAMGGYSG